MSDAWVSLLIYFGCYLLGVLIALAVQMYTDRRKGRQPKVAQPIFASLSPFSQPVTHGGLH